MATKLKIEKRGDEILKKSSPLKLLGKMGGFGLVWGGFLRGDYLHIDVTYLPKLAFYTVCAFCLVDNDCLA
jgi:hypothetical protein